VLQLILILPIPITDTQWDVTHSKTVYFLKYFIKSFYIS